jgi:hypothetical protein
MDHFLNFMLKLSLKTVFPDHFLHELDLLRPFVTSSFSFWVLVDEQADKDIHENQLGWHWMSPSDQVFIDLASDEILDDQKKQEPEVANDLAATMSDEKYSSLLGMLCDEAFFLVDEKTRQELPTLVPAHQDWVQCVSILHALGVKNGASLEKLRIALRGTETHSPISQRLFGLR